MSPLAEDLAQLALNPNELGPRLVLADALCERGHPLGELIQLSAQERWSPQLLELLAAHERAFCELVAPRALAAWVHRGLPEIAWYHSPDLLAQGPRQGVPLLRQVAVKVAPGQLAAVLSHRLLRNVTSLTLVCQLSEALGAAPELRSLESLTLCNAPARGIASLLKSLPGLRRLVLRSYAPLSSAGLLEALREARPALASLELELSGLSAADLEAAEALGVPHTRVGSSTAQSAEPGRERDDSLEVALEGSELVFTMRPLTWASHWSGDEPELVDPLVAELRSRAARADPLFARAAFSFVDAAPASREEHLGGDTLEQRTGRAPSAELLETFRALLLGVDALRPADLAPGAVCVAPATRVLSPWAHQPRFRERLAVVSPEEVRGLPSSAASSVFSLGVMLFQALAGKVPQLDTLSELSVLECTINGRFAKLQAGVPAALASTVEAMLSSAPAERPAPLGLAARLTALMQALPRDPSFRVSAASSPTVSLAAAQRFRPSSRT